MLVDRSSRYDTDEREGHGWNLMYDSLWHLIESPLFVEHVFHKCLFTPDRVPCPLMRRKIRCL